MCVCKHIYIYIYMYIERERERKRDREIYIDIIIYNESTEWYRKDLPPFDLPLPLLLLFLLPTHTSHVFPCRPGTPTFP